MHISVRAVLTIVAVGLVALAGAPPLWRQNPVAA